MTVRVLRYEPDYEVVPQAIIWRPLRYFTLIIRNGEDGLDEFKGASFTVGNDIRFDLRVYRGHPNPQVTSTLYLPEEVGEEERLSEIIDIVIQEMVIPLTAVAWRRGQTFEFGKLDRPKADRLREKEARVVVLKIAGSQRDRTASMQKLREEVPKFVPLSSEDRAPSKTRPNEQLWHQIIRNVTSSHPKGSEGLFTQGFARKTVDGLKVTKKGMHYLSSIGFSISPSGDVE